MTKVLGITKTRLIEATAYWLLATGYWLLEDAAWRMRKVADTMNEAKIRLLDENHTTRITLDKNSAVGS
jgi:hypothetical protein